MENKFEASFTYIEQAIEAIDPHQLGKDFKGTMTDVSFLEQQLSDFRSLRSSMLAYLNDNQLNPDRILQDKIMMDRERAETPKGILLEALGKPDRFELTPEQMAMELGHGGLNLRYPCLDPLTRNNIRTIEQLITTEANWSWDGIYIRKPDGKYHYYFHIDGLGPKRIDEILERLIDHGIAPKFIPEKPAEPAKETSDFNPPTLFDIDPDVMAVESEKAKANLGNIEAFKLVDDQELIDLEYLKEKGVLSTRTYNCLRRSNVRSINQVLRMTEEDLLSVINFGRKSLDEVLEGLVRLGILPKDKTLDLSADFVS